ncbi:MAG: transporter substrate-binding domain-containing protein, partial [Shewanella sp.]
MKKGLQISLTLVITMLLSWAPLQAQEIRFAMEATYPPFEFTNDKNEVIGFDVDLAKALCSVLNKQCSFHIQPFDSLIASLKFRRFDAAIS